MMKKDGKSLEWNHLSDLFDNIFWFVSVLVFENITGKYYPLLYLNNYWNLASDYMPINETTK